VATALTDCSAAVRPRTAAPALRLGGRYIIPGPTVTDAVPAGSAQNVLAKAEFVRYASICHAGLSSRRVSLCRRGALPLRQAMAREPSYTDCIKRGFENG
jgi:hypothetical protein